MSKDKSVHLSFGEGVCGRQISIILRESIGCYAGRKGAAGVAPEVNLRNR